MRDSIQSVTSRRIAGASSSSGQRIKPVNTGSPCMADLITSRTVSDIIDPLHAHCCLPLSSLRAVWRPRTRHGPGRFHVEHPTLLNLGFEWSIEGDANRNATVEVRFRKVGTEAWRPALPLLRIGGERVYRSRENMTYTVPDGFAGSILNLEPATSYECEFTLKDPDGVTGPAQQRVTVATRSRTEIVPGRARPPRLSSRP